MRTHARIAAVLSLIALCSVVIACKSDPFVGTWKPAPSGDNDQMRIDSLNINKDGTFSLKYKDSSRKEITGTHIKTGEKLELKSTEFKKPIEGTIDSDGKLKISEGGRDPVTFVKG